MKRAFTLIELMIAVALMVVLMISVGTIFKTAGQATGQGQAISEANRSAQAIQSTMSNDLGSAVTSNCPFFLIQSSIKAAFRNQVDQLSDRDYTLASGTATQIRTIDLDGDNVEGDSAGESIPNAIYNFREHRLDQISFFGRNAFHRQTGNDGVFIDSLESNEAFISYSILNLYDGVGTNTLSASYPLPGAKPVAASQNANNLYATQWILGRNALLFMTPDSTNNIKDLSGTNQVYVVKKLATDMSSLSSNTKDTNNTWLVQSSRYDLIGSSMDAERQSINSWCVLHNTATANPPTWWQNLEYNFWANPIFLRPANSQKMAQTTPLFIMHCTQFMVEFAGDYLNQDAVTGAINDVESYVIQDGSGNAVSFYTGTTDKMTDFIVTTDPGGTTHRQIRWYGMPRDTNGDGKVTIDPNPNNIVDVVPLRDIIQTRFPGASAAPMERSLPRVPSASKDYAVSTGGLRTTDTYTVAWGPSASYGSLAGVNIPAPSMPRMIRITVALDDPNGRLPRDGITYQFVFNLQ